MEEEVLVGVGVAVEVHRHEARELQEARIDLAAGARDAARAPTVMTWFVNQSVPRSIGDVVDGRRAHAGVDRAAREDHAQRDVRVAILLHERDGGEHRHRGLADGEDVHVAVEDRQHVAHVIDVVVETEASGRERDGAARPASR